MVLPTHTASAVSLLSPKWLKGPESATGRLNLQLLQGCPFISPSSQFSFISAQLPLLHEELFSERQNPQLKFGLLYTKAGMVCGNSESPP